jgi:tRNA(Ile)-lysidine synthase
VDALSPAARVEDFLRRWPEGRLRVGFSGGRDSSVLLALLAGSSAARQRDLLAIHVDHGLHPDSAQWARHAARSAAALDVPLELARVDLSGRREVGIEARARAARREVYAGHLQAGDWILLAHHQRDQAETLLLRLFAGAGPAGLGAMAEVSKLPPGRIGRPLLNLTDESIAACAAALALDWLEDPANRDYRHDRSWLRQALLPALRERTPQLDQRLARCADWMRQLNRIVIEQAATERARRQQGSPDQLAIDGWFELAEPLRFEIMASWLEELEQPRPGVVAFEQIEGQLIGAREDAEPLLHWGKGQLRRYRLHLCWIPAQAPTLGSETLTAHLGSPLALPDGRILISESVADVAPEADPKTQSIRISRRHGGERFRPAHERPSRPLKHLLQELAVPPWQRDRLLLIWHADTLIAVLDGPSGRTLLRNEILNNWHFRVATRTD